MNPFLAQRQIALVGVALLAIVAALVVRELPLRTEAERTAEERSVAAAGPDDWYLALAAPYEFPADTAETACGLPAEAETLGVAHPVLPCGAKLVIEHEGRYALTQVIDRGTGAPGREFDVVAPLARRLGLEGVGQLRWRFAAPEE